MAEFMRSLFENSLIRASAGTGKTFRLSNRYLRLLASGQSCDTILATTFTRKGAGEILDRIVNRLSQAALDPQAAENLSVQLDWKLDRERAADILHHVLQNLHRLEIGTLDSFFNRVAKAFSLELGLPPTWDIVEEQQIDQLHDEAIQSILRDENIGSILQMMSKGEANRRVATMVRDTVRFAYNIYRESTRDDWNRLEPQGRLMSEAELADILQRIHAVQPHTKAFAKHWATIVQSAQKENWKELCQSTSYQNFLDGKLKFGNSKLKPDVIEIYQRLLPHMQAVVSQQLIWQNRSTFELLDLFSHVLEKQKDETGQLRFDDITTRLLEWVRLWDPARFGFRLDHQIQHLLLDEFQDTSPSQWRIIEPFARQVTQDDPKRSFFCVGDMKQAIFGWRGGVAEIFDLVDQELPNLKSAELTASYRSAQPVIDMVNDVFLNLDQYQNEDPIVTDAIHSWPEWFEEHTTTKELDGCCTLEIAEDCDKSKHGDGDWVKQKERNKNVLRAAVRKIKNLNQLLPPDRTIGVLLRTNDAVAEMIFKLQREGIAASEEGGNPIVDSAAVELVLSLLRLADHPTDGVARFHLSHSCLAKSLGLEPESQQSQDHNRERALDLSAELRDQLLRQGYGPTIESYARELAPACTHREMLRLQHLVRVAYSNPLSSDRAALRPSVFAGYIRDELKVSDESSARVRVMTIHKSKGLEFDAVVLPMRFASQGFSSMPPSVVVGRDDPTAPINMASRYTGEHFRKLLPAEFQEMFNQDRRRGIRESMCLLYVALTRAVHATHVIMSYSARSNLKSTEAVLLSSLVAESRGKQGGGKKFSGVVYETGNRNWHYDLTMPEEKSDPSARFYLPAEASLLAGRFDQLPVSRRGLPTVRASQHEGDGKVRLGTIFERQDNAESLERGSMVHACLECIQWLDQGQPTRAELRQQLSRRFPASTLQDRVIDEFLATIQQPHLSQLLNQQEYLRREVARIVPPADIVLDSYRVQPRNEHRFAVKGDQELLVGTIDRLVLIYEANQVVAADIIDYKTEQVDEQSIESITAHYRPQMEAYRQAAARFTGLEMDRVHCRLVFLNGDRIVDLDHHSSMSAGSEQARPVPRPKHLKQQLKLFDD